jgi:hypothetical protein
MFSPERSYTSPRQTACRSGKKSWKDARFIPRADFPRSAATQAPANFVKSTRVTVHSDLARQSIARLFCGTPVRAKLPR